ncbi:hypothetical protein SmJEL517_g04584 [Synchytrium microbalum]|uniref:Cyclin n=1 Tax=Synchytrium microbalum TaxID=1806994 RepID=A0A507BRH2_9FUNG|nr:uncharacterized protein SmJEL517_g04584 [Synchytrium microbalum]TPX32290.1 hypothetical protein SmJEL517_g04584 [Synchytrium microbalum]
MSPSTLHLATQHHTHHHKHDSPVFDLAMPPAEAIKLLAAYLTQICADHKAPPTATVTRFHTRSIPNIDIYGYLVRILKYAPCGTDCFLAVLIYLNRMAHPDAKGLGPPIPRDIAKSYKHPEDVPSRTRLPLAITNHSIHRLLISSTMVAVKFLSDVFFTNVHISRVGGLPVNELNALEVEILMLNGFNLSVTTEELQECGNLLLRHSMKAIALDEALKSKLFISRSPPTHHSSDSTKIVMNHHAQEHENDGDETPPGEWDEDDELEESARSDAGEEYEDGGEEEDEDDGRVNVDEAKRDASHDSASSGDSTSSSSKASSTASVPNS